MGYYVIEKKIPIFREELLDIIIRKGVEISGGSDLIHAHIWIPEGKENDVLKILKNDGFYLSETYCMKRHKD